MAPSQQHMRTGGISPTTHEALSTETITSEPAIGFFKSSLVVAVTL